MCDTIRIYLHRRLKLSGLATMNVDPSAPWWAAGGLATSHLTSAFVSLSQVKEAMQRIHDRGNIGKLILDVEKTPTPLVS